MNYHQPVLLGEAIKGLNIRHDGIYVDLTFGGGGHSGAILEKLNTGKLIAFDQDREAVTRALDDKRFTFIRGNFRYVKNYLINEKIEAIDGAMADLGVSSHHFDVEERGFSFRFKTSRLDMRMNQDAELTATLVLNQYKVEELEKIFHEYGEIHNSVHLAEAINDARSQQAIERVDDLLRAIQDCMPNHYKTKYLAKVFQALRIEVNDEINALAEMLEQVTGLLKKSARFVVITYHSLEDRLVKNLFRTGNVKGDLKKDFYGNPELVFRQINRNVIVPGQDELNRNPRARSAKLRIAERL